MFVVKKDPALTAEALMEHCHKYLTGYKLPRHIYFRTELPKTNVGKILRRALRDELTPAYGLADFRAPRLAGFLPAAGAMIVGFSSTR